MHAEKNHRKRSLTFSVQLDTTEPGKPKMEGSGTLEEDESLSCECPIGAPAPAAKAER